MCQAQIQPHGACLSSPCTQPTRCADVISISADVPLRILRTKNGFIIGVGDLVQIRGVSYDQVAGTGAAFVAAYIPGDPGRRDHARGTGDWQGPGHGLGPGRSVVGFAQEQASPAANAARSRGATKSLRNTARWLA